MLRFAWLELFALLPLPLLIWRFVPPADLSQAALRVPFYAELSAQAGHRSSPAWRRQAGRLLLLTLIWLCLVVASARPQYLGETANVPLSGRQVMLAVDISRSMATPDMHYRDAAQSRLEAVKRVASEFIARRGGDSIGLILFGTRAYLQTPLSPDRHSVTQLLLEANIGIAGDKTALGDAIGLALKRFEQYTDRDKVLILLTDGSNTAGALPPAKAAELANTLGLKIHTIGIGATEFAVESFFGNRVVNPARDLDEALLQHIATTTGGQYFRATDTASLQRIYALIDQLDPVEQQTAHLRPVQELFYWPLGAGIVLTLAALLWRLSVAVLAQRRPRAADTPPPPTSVA